MVEMKKLTLKNYMLLENPDAKTISLQAWLAPRMLHGKESRARTRFLKLMSERITEMDTERMRLLKEHAVKKMVKGKDGKKTEQLVYLDKDEKETTDKNIGKKFKMKDNEAFQRKYWEYLNEDYVIDVSPATSETIYGVRDLLLNTKEEFAGRQATIFDEWCQALESIK